TRRHPGAPVLMTEATHRIGDVMLHNSVNVMLRQREADKILDYPLFTHRGVELSRQKWLRCPLRRPLSLSGERAASGEATTVEFFDAGHILGSTGVLIRHQGRTLFYTGDVHFDDQTLMRGADFPASGVDVLVMETTRGDSPVPPGFTRAAEEARFGQAILDAFARGSCVTIPVFALGKTQELLAMLWKLRHQGTLPSTPIYIGGLSTKITEVYDALAASSQRSLADLQLLQEVAPYVVSGNDVANLSPRKRCIFALSSGMMTERTLSNFFARKVLEDESQHLFFVGYSDPESPAGRIKAARRGDAVILDENLPPLRLRCQVDQFNFSAHATRDSLRDYAIKLKPKKILLVHGDAPAVAWFRRELSAALPETEILVPEPGKTLSL
ncbi:MAG TPA: MBL fold metallo-hydrolase, partial [Chthoniobacterales bacterium]